MAEQLADRGCAGRMPLEFGQIGGHPRIEVHLRRLDQLHDRKRGKAFRYGPDHEGRVGGDHDVAACKRLAAGTQGNLARLHHRIGNARRARCGQRLVEKIFDFSGT